MAQKGKIIKMKGYIYVIKNTINDKVYVGQTSRTIEDRWKQHKNNALRGEDQGVILYNAIRKYGVENFYISLLEEVDLKELNDKEKYWIKKLNSKTPNGYNVREGGEDPGRKEVYKIDIKTNKIIECYGSATAAADANNVDLSYLTKVCRREENSCGEYKWSYSENYDPVYLKNIKTKKNKSSVYQINPNNGEIIQKFESIASAAKANHIDASTISHVLRGRHATAGGYNWCYVDNYNKDTFKVKTSTKPVLQYDKNDNFIKEWKDAKEAGLFLNKNPSVIRKACREERKTAYGFKWRYKENI